MEDTRQQNQNGEVLLRISVSSENLREELSFFSELSDIFREYGKDTSELDFVTDQIQKQIEEFDSSTVSLPDKKLIENVIRNHPYFRNPCDYPIRLLTILKYLKRMGVNVNYADIDLYVDSIVCNMKDVKKVGRGLYMCKKNK